MNKKRTVIPFRLSFAARGRAGLEIERKKKIWANIRCNALNQIFLFSSSINISRSSKIIRTLAFDLDLLKIQIYFLGDLFLEIISWNIYFFKKKKKKGRRKIPFFEYGNSIWLPIWIR